MVDYINIVSKEDILRPSASVSWTLFAICCAILLVPTIVSYIIVKIKHKDLIKVVWTELVAGCIALIFCAVTGIVIVPSFNEPTGSYSYKVTINKDKITVSEYEEFLEKFKPEIRDGYYYFEYEGLE